jgi:hypothetical protein
MRIIFIVISIVMFFSSCTEKKETRPITELELKMNSIAEAYVKLVLKIGQHDADFVDAYFGPEEWKPADLVHDGNDTLVHRQLTEEADNLLDELEALSVYKADELETLRYRYLYKQLLAAKTKLFMISGGLLGFDEESKALYDAVSPTYSEEHYKQIIDKLDKILPGSGNVSERLNEYRKSFIIPIEKLDTVFNTAINECRKRTLQHLNLPKEENFKVEYVTDKPWGGYNWYKGNSFSLIQVNTDLPVYIDRAVDLAAHEGYPGHHVYNLLLEKNLYKEKSWVEFSVYILFSPQSLIAEGTANYGIEVAFPGESRIKFEKEFLFPLAGLNPATADEYYKVSTLLEELSYAGNEAARNYLGGKWSKDETKSWLVKYSLMSPEKADKNIQFIEKYRSYVINYNLGKDIVKNYIEKNGGTADNSVKRWELFEHLISTPQTPSGLKEILTGKD